MHENHQDPVELDLTNPRLASYKQKWKVHQDTVYWVDIQLAQLKRIEVLLNQIERNHPLRYTPSLLYPESGCDEIWRDSYTRRYMCHLDHRQRFRTKDHWTYAFHSDVARSRKDTQRIEPKLKTQLTSTVKTCYKMEWRNPGTYQVWLRHS